MARQLPDLFANIDDRIAKPGDPGLDCHLTGLRIAALVILPGDRITERTLTFDTREAAGFWADPETGGRVFPDTVTSLEITAGLGMRPGFRHLADIMLRRLEAWRADAALIALTSAPGKWTLLHCPDHPAGALVPVPRTGALP
jgi:hypothetical protein